MAVFTTIPTLQTLSAYVAAAAGQAPSATAATPAARQLIAEHRAALTEGFPVGSFDFERPPECPGRGMLPLPSPGAKHFAQAVRFGSHDAAVLYGRGVPCEDLAEALQRGLEYAAVDAAHAEWGQSDERDLKNTTRLAAALQTTTQLGPAVWQDGGTPPDGWFLFANEILERERTGLHVDAGPSPQLVRDAPSRVDPNYRLVGRMLLGPPVAAAILAAISCVLRPGCAAAGPDANTGQCHCGTRIGAWVFVAAWLAVVVVNAWSRLTIRRV